MNNLQIIGLILLACYILTPFLFISLSFIRWLKREPEQFTIEEIRKQFMACMILAPFFVLCFIIILPFEILELISGRLFDFILQGMNNYVQRKRRSVVRYDNSSRF